MPTQAPAAQRGSALYADYCAICDGGQAINGGKTPDLRKTSSEILDMMPEILVDGVLAPSGMPSFAHILTPENAKDIGGYLKSQSLVRAAPMEQS